MALGLTLPLTEMSIRSISLPPSCAVVMKSGNLKFLEPSGSLQACNGTAFTILYTYRYTVYTILYTYFWPKVGIQYIPYFIPTFGPNGPKVGIKYGRHILYTIYTIYTTYTILYTYFWPKVGIQYTGCHRRNGPNFRKVFLMLKYTYIQS